MRKDNPADTLFVTIFSAHATIATENRTYEVKGPFHSDTGGTNMEDSKIIALYIARDEQAIRETEAKYGRLCFRVANNILANDADAEECVNDGYLGVWNRIPPTRPVHFSAFLCRIVRNLSLKKLAYLSAEKRASNAALSFEELEQVLPDHCVASDAGEQRLGQLISDFLRAEKADARNVFLRKYWFFDSVSDIAARYGFSESKVKSMLLRTRNRLKDYLTKEGIPV